MEDGVDSTGFLLWAGSDAMCRLLVDVQSTLVHGASVLELGAGCGICGFLAAGLGARFVDITDWSDRVLDQVRVAIPKQPRAKLGKVRARLLDWRLGDELIQSQDYTLVIAADVIYPDVSDHVLSSLCHVLRERLVRMNAPGPDGIQVQSTELTSPSVLMSYVDRDLMETGYRFWKTAKAAGLRLARIRTSRTREKLDAILLVISIDRLEDEQDELSMELVFPKMCEGKRIYERKRDAASLTCTCSSAVCIEDRCGCSRCKILQQSCSWLEERQALPWNL